MKYKYELHWCFVIATYSILIYYTIMIGRIPVIADILFLL